MTDFYLFILVVLLGVVLVGGLRPGTSRSRRGFPPRLRAASGAVGLGLALIVAAATFLEVRSGGGELEPSVGRILVATRPPTELPSEGATGEGHAAPLGKARFLFSLMALEDGLPGIRRLSHIDVVPFAWPDDAKKSVRRQVELPGTTVDIKLRIAEVTHWRSRREEDRGAPLVSLGVRSEVQTFYKVGTTSGYSKGGGDDRLVIGPPGAERGSSWPVPVASIARPHGIVRYARALGSVLPSGIDRGASIYLAVERIAEDDPLREVSVEEFRDGANAVKALRERGEVEGSRAFSTPLEQGAELSGGYALFALGGGGTWLLLAAGFLLARAFPLPSLAAPGVALVLVLLVAALEGHAVSVRGRTLLDPSASPAEKVAAARGLETTFFYRETARERVREAASAAEASGLPEGLSEALRALAEELR